MHVIKFMINSIFILKEYEDRDNIKLSAFIIGVIQSNCND